MSMQLIPNKNFEVTDSKLSKFIHQVLAFCLRWIRDEELQDGEELIIYVRKNESPMVFYNKGSVSYRPYQEHQRQLQLSEWKGLEKGGRIKLDKLEKLLRKHLPECNCKVVEYKGVKMLSLDWNPNVSFSINKDIAITDTREGISVSYCILSGLILKPDLIGSRICTNSFKEKMVLVFKNKNAIVLEGKGASYILTQEGWRYLNVKSVDILQGSEVLRARIPHDKGYDNWFETLIKIIDKEQ